MAHFFIPYSIYKSSFIGLCNDAYNHDIEKV